MRGLINIDSTRILDEVEVALFDLAAARDFPVDGGELYQIGNRRDAALARIRAAMKGLCHEVQRLLLRLGEAEGCPRELLPQIRKQALALGELVRPNGGLDLLLDQLDDLREFTEKYGTWAAQSARADLMEVRMHLHEIHRNYVRMAGLPLSA